MKTLTELERAAKATEEAHSKLEKLVDAAERVVEALKGTGHLTYNARAAQDVMDGEDADAQELAEAGDELDRAINELRW